MSNSTESRALRQFARICLDFLLDPRHELRLDEAAARAMHSLGSPGMHTEDLKGFGRRMRDSVRFQEGHLGVARRWQPRWGDDPPPDDAQASAFLGDFMELVDHSIFFDQGITAGITHNRQGEPAAQHLDFPGGMPCWTLHLSCRGSALFLNEEMELRVGRGSLMLFHPDAHYHYGLAPGAMEWKHLWVLFQPRSHWGEWLHWEAIANGIYHIQLPDERSIAEMESLFTALIGLRNEALPYRSELEHNRLEEILIRARGYMHPRAEEAIDQRVASACEFMERRLSQRFSVDDVAAACNLSPSRLAHLFKQQMGVGPKAWSNNLRLQHARRLLLSSGDSIASIATRIGYDDPTQFARNFRLHVGCSPRDFRKSFQPG